MRSPLDAIDGTFEHAIFTSYAISLSFFEQWVLPLLAHTGVRNVVVFADADQVGDALLDPGAQRVGTAYHVAPTSLGPGAFHPKIMLLIGGGGQRLVVSSANLTVSGQLRNLEAAIVLDSAVETHRPAITQAAAFVRHIASEAPSHVIEAVIPALTLVEPVAEVSTGIEFVHNLTISIGSRLPPGDLTVAVAYADADGRALTEISRDRDVRCIVDGDHFEAGEGFFAASNTLDARTWATAERRRRVLHAKAYWTTQQVMLGSPNLSAPGLLSTGATGNVEAALLIDTEGGMPDPGGTPWAGELRQAAVARRSHVVRRTENAHARAFHAWEEDGSIRVDGVPNGSPIEAYAGIGWISYGEVVNGRVIAATQTLRPRLLRSLGQGVERVAAVHRVVELRIRRTRRLSGRSTEVVHTLPLDLEGVRLLEEVLAELFTLGELARDHSRAGVPVIVTTPESQLESTLTEWRPANPGGEPRIPEVYRRLWSKDPDALLALVQAALRIPVALPDQLSEFDLLTEAATFGGAEDPVGLDVDVDPEEPDAIPTTTESVLQRYRQSFRRLMDRGASFVKTQHGSVLGDLAFQMLMQQAERLVVAVEVDGRREYLVDHGDARRFRLRLLAIYLGEDVGMDPVCAATARYHLADLISSRRMWEPLEWETIERLAYKHAGGLEETAEPIGVDVLGMSSQSVSTWLDHYARRADWLGVVEHAAETMSEVDFALEPYPMIYGIGPVEPASMTPAWNCLGYGVIAGTADVDPYGISVHAATGGPYDMHVLVFDPGDDALHEAMRRRKDGMWLVRRYQPVGRGDLDRVGRLGPFALSDAARTPLSEVTVDQLPALVGRLARFAAGERV